MWNPIKKIKEWFRFRREIKKIYDPVAYKLAIDPKYGIDLALDYQRAIEALSVLRQKRTVEARKIDSGTLSAKND